MKLLRKIFMVLGFSLCMITAYAACPPNDPFCNDDGEEPDPWGDIPIDGGALALLAGGAALGYKALKKKKEEGSEK
ncbi:PID-CTERM protein-sorting domain-containing protein [Pseudopedobacter beijingensis]|uniref:PID-CTERM protein-sorting domain-containing protein n=1 Tax=Pseudopedobacter beijingensis TaxID=1207056 RepID=A0ABW4I9F4_9SPHI